MSRKRLRALEYLVDPHPFPAPILMLWYQHNSPMFSIIFRVSGEISMGFFVVFQAIAQARNFGKIIMEIITRPVNLMLNIALMSCFPSVSTDFVSKIH